MQISWTDVLRCIQAASIQAERWLILLISVGHVWMSGITKNLTPYDFARNSMKSDFESYFFQSIRAQTSYQCSDLDILNYVEWHMPVPLLTVPIAKLNDVYLATMKVAEVPTYLRENMGVDEGRIDYCKVENHECSMARLMRMYGERTEQLKQAIDGTEHQQWKESCIELIQLADAGKLNLMLFAIPERQRTEVADL